MSKASNSAGLVGKWGRASFFSKTASSGPTMPHPMAGKSNKIFTTRNTTRTPPSSSSFSSPPPPASALPRPATPALALPTPVRKACESGKVEVTVRLRPRLDAEKKKEEEEGEGAASAAVVEADEDKGELFVNFEKSFKFDRVFGPTSTQEGVFSLCVRPLLEECLLDGRHVAVIAYGQTGTGKTFTMGTDHKVTQTAEALGIVPRAVEDIFQATESGDLTVKVAFFEILNDKIYDLLNAHKFKVPLKLKESGSEFVLPDLTQRVARSSEEVLALLAQGSSTRSTGATAQNETSSRSHAVFRLTLERQAAHHPTAPSVPARLSFVDLAGSESTARAETDGMRRKEGVSINKGLSVLGRCVTAICKKEKHIPFRDASLTKVLRESLTGGGVTSMIACVSPTETDLRETISTLRYADSVKKMQKPEVPVHLLVQAELYQSARKRRLGMIPPTPGQPSGINSTIATPTPTKKRRVALQQRMNSTMNSLGVAPSSSSSFYSMSSKTPSLETIVDADDSDNMSDVSSIRGGSASAGNSGGPTFLNATSVVDASQMRSVLSPMLRQMAECLASQMGTRMEEVCRENLERTRQELLGATLRRSPRLAARREVENVASLSRHQILAEDSSESIIGATPVNAAATDKDETVISGPALAAGREEVRMAQENCESPERTPKLRTRQTPLKDVTNLEKREHLRKVEATASPALKKTTRGTPEKSAMEMAADMGIDMDSPSLVFSARRPSRILPEASPNGTISAAPPTKRSVRRTTMMQGEIRASMAPLGLSGDGLRRSKRLSTRPPPPTITHALEERSMWRIENQERHNAKILAIVNTANLRVLQSLPGIGAKTAISIHSFRELHGKFGSLRELEEVKGVQRAFFRKFCERNQVAF